jgi:hypothetical protein
MRLVRFPAAPPRKAGQGHKPWPAFLKAHFGLTPLNSFS